MADKLHFRQLLLLVLALVYRTSQKEIGVRSKMSGKSVSKYLQPRKYDIPERIFYKMLDALPCRPAAVPAVTACLEALQALEPVEDLTAADLREIENGILLASRLLRDGLTEGLRRARSKPAPGYPQPADLAAHRFRAGEQLERLKALPADQRVEVLRQAPEFQTWALCEKACEESTRQAARDVEEALRWAKLAHEIAGLVEGPEGWRRRLQGYALGHVANAVRVAGDLVDADALIAEAKLQWEAGEDPESVLDPGRLLDLEACLRRDQRRFDEAVTLLDQAEKVSRSPEKAMLNKGFTLEVMGEYGRAVETLQQAAPLVENQADRRLKYVLRLNLANNFCHLGRFKEAADLVRRAHTQVADIGNTIDLIRILWLEGRIAAGLDKPLEALRFLTEARRRFAASGMSYDVALVLLEEAIVLLSQCRIAEVKALAQELIGCFQSKGVHREAQAALKLFVEAAASEMATIELTRNLVSYLHRARHDQNLHFDTQAKG